MGLHSKANRSICCSCRCPQAQGSHTRGRLHTSLSCVLLSTTYLHAAPTKDPPWTPLDSCLICFSPWEPFGASLRVPSDVTGSTDLCASGREPSRPVAVLLLLCDRSSGPVLVNTTRRHGRRYCVEICRRNPRGAEPKAKAWKCEEVVEDHFLNETLGCRQ